MSNDIIAMFNDTTAMFNDTTAMFNITTEDDYDNMMAVHQQQITYINTLRMLYISGYGVICLFGVVLNLLVIFQGGCYHGNSNTAKWVMALAVTHLICSAFLPLQLLYSWYHFNWHYGTALCKVSSYIFYGSMFSTAGMLTLWSITDGTRLDQCTRNHCVTFRHSSIVMIMILISWTFAAILSIPSLYSRELRYTVLGEECIDDYDLNDETTTEAGRRNITIVVICRFLLGILIPGFMMSICFCCQRKDTEKKSKQIKCLIKVVYIVCWTPLLFMGLLQTLGDPSSNQFLTGSSYALPLGTVLAAAHCCINPVIYLLVSDDFKMQWMKVAQEPTNL